MDKIIYQSTKLKCDAQKAFEMFTVNEHLEKWLCETADVEARVGGKYELFWNPKDRENDSTIGCKILAINSAKVLCFEWKGPKQFKHFMNRGGPLTHVIVFFSPQKEDTEIHLIHTGWGSTREWEEARLWFDKAWVEAFLKLQKYVNKK
jgi:uncharacterized protein YndB with AHSA1/START domain